MTGHRSLAAFLAALLDGAGDWQERALCQEIGGDVFFPEKGEPTRDAKAACMRCEVRVDCLEDALARNDRYGVWGGKSERERRKILKNKNLPEPESHEGAA